MRNRSPNYSEQLESRCAELAELLIPSLRYQAEICGYAIGVHGSLKRDIDLIAVPWREGAISPESLIRALAEIVRAVHGNSGIDDEHFVIGPTQQPCGRKSWVIHLSPDLGAGPYLDISVIEVR